MFSEVQVHRGLVPLVALLVVLSACVSADDEPRSLLEPAPPTTVSRQEPLRPDGETINRGTTIEPGVEYRYPIYTHCGIEWLGEFNDVLWRADVPAGVLDYVPAAWARAVDDAQRVVVTLVLTTKPDPVITATVNEVEIAYRPTTEDPPGCD